MEDEPKNEQAVINITQNAPATFNATNAGIKSTSAKGGERSVGKVVVSISKQKVGPGVGALALLLKVAISNQQGNPTIRINEQIRLPVRHGGKVAARLKAEGKAGKARRQALLLLAREGVGAPTNPRSALGMSGSGIQPHRQRQPQQSTGITNRQKRGGGKKAAVSGWGSIQGAGQGVGVNWARHMSTRRQCCCWGVGGALSTIRGCRRRWRRANGAVGKARYGITGIEARCWAGITIRTITGKVRREEINSSGSSSPNQTVVVTAPEWQEPPQQPPPTHIKARAQRGKAGARALQGRRTNQSHHQPVIIQRSNSKPAGRR